MAYEYQIGGSLPLDAPSYIPRQADQDFYDGLKKGEFCYVLNARQMGKSSLRVRTIQRLQAEGIACATIDITEIGSTDATLEQWYAGLIDIIAQTLHITDFNLDTWWENHHHLSPVHHFAQAYQQDLEISKQLAKDDPTSVTAQRDLLVSYTKMASAQLQSGNLEVARQAFEQALAIAEQLAAIDPLNQTTQNDLRILRNRVESLSDASE